MTRRTFRELRRNRFLTQEQLAQELGVNPNSVIAWEKGKSLPRPAMFRRICEFFGVRPEDIIFGDDDAEPKERAAA